MRRLLVALFIPALFTAALVSPVQASDKFTVHDDQPMDDARRPEAGKALIYFVRTQTMGYAVKVDFVPVAAKTAKRTIKSK